MRAYLQKSKWSNKLDEGKFIKEATPIANKLNWDASKIQYLAYLLNNQVKSKK